MQSLGHDASGFIKRSITVLVGNGYESTGCDQFLRNCLIPPETSIVQGSVPMFICDVNIGTISKQLQTKLYVICFK